MGKTRFWYATSNFSSSRKNAAFSTEIHRKSFPASMNFFLQFPAGCDIINVAKSHASSGSLVPFAEVWAEIQGEAEV